MARALAEFIYSLTGISGLYETFIIAMAVAAPRSSKTIDTVVDVGSPIVLKTSSRIMSVSITAINIIIISEK